MVFESKDRACPLCGYRFRYDLGLHLKDWHDLHVPIWRCAGLISCICGRQFKDLDGDRGFYEHFCKHGKDCIIVSAMK